MRNDLTWPTYQDGEVAVFHPAFEAAANEALAELGIAHTHEWDHHPASAGVGVVPDFVLKEKATGRWILVVEIKRTLGAVQSERTQIQGKGYAEANSSRFRNSAPRYFALTNLELLQLFALRNGLPPRDCVVEGQTYDCGRLAGNDPTAHRNRLVTNLAKIVRFSLDERDPSFTTVWPAIVETMFQHARELPFRQSMAGATGTLPSEVQDYFGPDREDAARDEMLLRCLIAEYARGILLRHSHPGASRLRPIGSTLASTANIMRVLRSIDFSGVIEDTAGALYLSFENEPAIRSRIQNYLATLLNDRVADLANTRADASTITDLIVRASKPITLRDMRGKTGTDPELADLLASFCIGSVHQHVLDPGCGEGNLLSASYDRLSVLGATHQQALQHLSGIEADGIATRIAGLRLALKEPRALSAEDPVVAKLGDMFSEGERIASADVILMNPPFKRYETQDDAPLPPELRSHMVRSVESLGHPSVTAVGQWNTLAVYSEFVVKAAKENATLGLVLDNKWFHNSSSRSLRRLFKENCRILAVVTYPHGRFFEGVMIATSMIIMEKGEPAADHKVLFLRVDDPASAPSNATYNAIRGGALPLGWSVNHIDQSSLGETSWKAHLAVPLLNEYRRAPLVRLTDLFSRSRRGSLAKEAGPVALFEFPVDRRDYGPTVSRRIGGGPFQTTPGVPLTSAQNATLKRLASMIPQSCLGFALNKADRATGYYLKEADLRIDPTIELPLQRTPNYAALYHADRRVAWTTKMSDLVSDISNHQELADYVNSISTEVGLNNTVLPEEQLWNVLREPYAGALIIPRKLRTSHHVHINPFAFETGRQVRLSSNFISYGACLAVDPILGLDEETATTLIAAWLVSSFGHLQFELEGNNREGMRSIEKSQTDNILVLDPRIISDRARTDIIAAFKRLPYSIRTDLHPSYQSELSQLDELFAAELGRSIVNFDSKAALAEVQDLLHDLHEARQ